MPKNKFASNTSIEQREIIYKFCKEKGPNATARKSLKLIGKRLQRHQVTRYVKQYEAHLAEQVNTAQKTDAKKNQKRKSTPIRYPV